MPTGWRFKHSGNHVQVLQEVIRTQSGNHLLAFQKHDSRSTIQPVRR